MRSAAHADASRRWGGLIVRSPEHAESPSFRKPPRSHERGRRPPCPLRQRANSVCASGRARSVLIPRRPAGPFHGSGTRSEMLGNSVRSPSDSNGAQSAIRFLGSPFALSRRLSGNPGRTHAFFAFSRVDYFLYDVSQTFGGDVV